jgi:hypothetical protein
MRFLTTRSFLVIYPPFLYTGKPYAHVYVDDLAVNSLMDTRRELGWKQAVGGEKAPSGMVLPRSINNMYVTHN